ncbi:MAG: twitching motility protein PilT [Verrucomicrobiales bacterium]|jgi:twitching motility protein PilT
MSKIVEYLQTMVSIGGSDLHLTVGAPPNARVDGTMRPIAREPLDRDAVYQLVMAILSDRQRSVLEEKLELDFAINIDSLGRFRGNAHYNRGSVEAAFRFIPDEIPELAALGHQPIVEQLCELRRGLILVTGITGSGKTTTLASMIKRISEVRSGVIISIEDPIEFIFKHSRSIVKQREVGQDTLSFSAALRHTLRQDPDVILVSEMRDLETMQAAVTAAETGHLVLSTLHTIDAPKALDRMVDAFPAAQQGQIIAQLANSLEAVISQRLLPHASGEGRILASEVMMMNYAIRTCLRQKKFEQILGLMEIGSKEGMHTIDENLSHLIQQGQIGVDDALANCRDPGMIEQAIANSPMAQAQTRR